MESNLLIIIVIAIIVQALVLYIVIATAVRTKQRTNMDWARMKLLEKIALRQGVPKEEIRQIMNQI